MAEALENVKQIWENYSLTTISLVLYWLSLVWLILYKKDIRKSTLFIYALLIPAMVAVLQLAGILSPGEHSPDKLMYVFPTAILICYVGTEIGGGRRAAKKTWILIALYAIIIQTGMSLRYDEKLLVEGMNTYKVSSPVWKLSECINGDPNISEPYVLAPDEIACQIQEMDSNIRTVYGNYDYTSRSLEELLFDMIQLDCNCLVLRYSEETVEYMKNRDDYRLVAVVENEYVLYARI